MVDVKKLKIKRTCKIVILFCFKRLDIWVCTLFRQILVNLIFFSTLHTKFNIQEVNLLMKPDMTTRMHTKRNDERCHQFARPELAFLRVYFNQLGWDISVRNFELSQYLESNKTSANLGVISDEWESRIDYYLCSWHQRSPAKQITHHNLLEDVRK